MQMYIDTLETVCRVRTDKLSDKLITVYSYGTRPLSRCYHDKMTLEPLLNQFKSKNSFLGRRTYPEK